jgi:hypothetical protein
MLMTFVYRRYVYTPHPHLVKKVERALDQPLQFLDREPLDDSHSYPQEKFTIIGSHSNNYTVTMKLVPQCTCPDFVFRRASCKHLIYTLHYVLKVPLDSKLLYQIAFTSTELKAMFDISKVAAPPIKVEEIAFDPKRKPIEGDCPICYMELNPDSAVTYCKAKCGQNIHQQCVSTWIRAQQRTHGKKTCPYCRENWLA